MKKIFRILILILLFWPVATMAKEDGISNYYIEATVLPTGDLHVKELFVLEGKFNGYERIIKYKNINAMLFDGSENAFMGSDIYNATGLELLKIKAIEVDKNINFDYLYKDGDEFIENFYASVGDYGYYTVSRDYDGYIYRIYNSSSYGKKGFYVEYILKDLAIVHNDIAEIGWNLFTSEQTESIKNLEMIVKIPNNQNEIRVWGHGPLNGETSIVDKNTLSYKITDLSKQTPIDIRFVFDRSVIYDAIKSSHIEALDKILAVEQKWADEANEKREIAKKIEARKKRLSIISDIVKVIWLAGLGYIIYNAYHKHDKEYQTAFKTQYFRDFPANYGPYCVGYLMNKKIGPNEFSSTILDLIERKYIKYQEPKKKEYILIRNTEQITDDLTNSEKHLMKMLFDKIGSDNTVTIKKINQYAKRNYQSFLNYYNDWKDLALEEAENQNFYEEKGNVKTKIAVYIIIGLLFIFITLPYTIHPFINVLAVISGVISLIYVINIKKRTQEGQEQYARWMGLKRFLNDFGKFEARELPQIHLWEKYLVYAVVFGIAKKLAKAMEVKINEMPATTQYTVGDYIFDINRIRIINSLNDSVSQGINNAVSTALSAKAISESKTSSGGGFGGGFSGGGGSFGGGGGGGRF